MLRRTERTLSTEDAKLLDEVQRRAIAYYWENAHPVSGLARFRSDVTPRYSADHVTTGGSGFGIMAIIVGVHRGWITRKAAVEHLLKMTEFLLSYGTCYHGALPHLLNGTTGQTISFRPCNGLDDGGDTVETAFFIAGLLCARQYFDDKSEASERELHDRCNILWSRINWRWYTKGTNFLYWHWSPNNGWDVDHNIRGWHEGALAYILAVCAPRERYAADPMIYSHGWSNSSTFKTERSYYGVELPLGPHLGGPLFFAHYSFLGLDPRGLEDAHTNYWAQNRAHTLVNRAYCIHNPKGFKGYGPKCWGLTAADDQPGMWGCDPNEDAGVIRPWASITSMPYTPEESMEVLRFLRTEADFRDTIWGPYGFWDWFCLQEDRFADFCYATAQGPMAVMIENFRSGLIWELFMSCPEILAGLRKLNFKSPHLT